MYRRSVSAAELEYYRAHFLEALQEDGVVCLECGAVFQAVGSHIRRHGLIAEDYRDKWGYNRQTSLVTDALQEAFRQRAITRGFGLFDPSEARLKAVAARRGVSPPPLRAEGRLNLGAAVRARYTAGARPASLKVEDETLRALASEGLTFRPIATRTGLDRSQVRKRIRALGLIGPAIAPRLLKASNATLVALGGEGLWASQIAALTRMATGAVRARLRRLRRGGVAVPPPTRPRPNPWRRVSDEEILSLVGRGLRRAEIAARVGLSPAGVKGRLRAIRHRGLLPPAARKAEPQMTDRELVELGRAGLWASEIAVRTRMPAAAVRRRLYELRRRGVPLPAPVGPVPNRWRRVSDQQLVALEQEGLRPSEIAAWVGLRRPSLSRRLGILRQRGLLPPPAPSKPSPPTDPPA